MTSCQQNNEEHSGSMGRLLNPISSPINHCSENDLAKKSFFLSPVDSFPEDELRKNGQCVCSTLYLIRRDVCKCFGYKPSERKHWIDKIGDTTIVNGRSYDNALLGVVGICSAIDLLAKFYAGDYSTNEVGKKFKDFLNAYLKSISNQPDLQDALYAARCSLVHSYGVNNKKIDISIKNCADPQNRSVVKSQGNNYDIMVVSLHKEFEMAINTYCNDLSENNSLKTNFFKVLPHCGFWEWKLQQL